MKFSLKLASAGLFLVSAPLLHANSFLFTITNPDHVISFSLPSAQAPDQSGEDFENIPFFFFNNIAVTVDGVTTNQGVLFADNGDQRIAIGNKWFVSPEDEVIANHFFEGFFEEAKGIFSGTAANPTFIPGSESGFLIEPGQVNEPTVELDIETVATPEPNNFVLLGSGLLGFAGVLRRKFDVHR